MLTRAMLVNDADTFYRWVRFAGEICLNTSHAQWLFRGQPCNTFDLYTTLTRKLFGEATFTNPLFALLEDERRLLECENKLINYARQFVSPSMSKLQVMCEMRHLGLPTRLLDVTLSPFVALFMALLDADFGKTASVWAFKYTFGAGESFATHMKQQAEEFERILEYDVPMLISHDVEPKIFCITAPVQFDRIVAQKGCFLSIGRLGVNLQDNILERLGATDYVGLLQYLPGEEILRLSDDRIARIRFDFPPTIQNLALYFLDTVNISKKTMFPEIQRVSTIPKGLKVDAIVQAVMEGGL